jgi:CDP-paratose 2-epimerase
MKVLLTGCCGFLGASLAERLSDRISNLEIFGIDNFSRSGSELNRARLTKLGCQVRHGDIRLPEDLEHIPRVDWVLDCAALPSVLAGVNGGAAQLVGNNLVGTLNLLEKCRRDGAGMIMISTSRVYSIPALSALPLVAHSQRFEIDERQSMPTGFSPAGVAEDFSTTAPISLYGATKLASEQMALEYGYAFGLPVRVNRCGVIAGPGQFGRIDQGIFSYWVYQWLRRRPLAYIGFGGSGQQVRDFISPVDLSELLALQLAKPAHPAPPVLNVGGGRERAMSLRELSSFCRDATSIDHTVTAVPETRTFDIPYYVTDSANARRAWNWAPREAASETLEAIVRWGRDHLTELDRFG